MKNHKSVGSTRPQSGGHARPHRRSDAAVTHNNSPSCGPRRGRSSRSAQSYSTVSSFAPTPLCPRWSTKKMEENIAQFCGVTGASVKDAKKFLDKYKRVDVAVDAYYGDPAALAATTARPAAPAASTSKLNALFDKYKDPDADEITVDGTIRLCQDLGVDPEDVVLLAVAFELKSPRVGEWNRSGWVEGWKNIGCDTLPAMKTALPRLKTKLGQDPAYFQKVYNHTFEFAKQQGQRSIGACLQFPALFYSTFLLDPLPPRLPFHPYHPRHLPASPIFMMIHMHLRTCARPYLRLHRPTHFTPTLPRTLFPLTRYLRPYLHDLLSVSVSIPSLTTPHRYRHRTSFLGASPPARPGRWRSGTYRCVGGRRYGGWDRIKSPLVIMHMSTAMRVYMVFSVVSGVSNLFPSSTRTPQRCIAGDDSGSGTVSSDMIRIGWLANASPLPTGGWKPEYVEWWFEFLQEKGGKGVSKDTWNMFHDFVRTIDVRFETYDETAAWPSTIDDFVLYAKERVNAS
ncbi:Defective in cullin neddylation protein [Mycena sanguinolenta]|uniref:Defective in cullin neddylation protein n=1 Tax=Mycena sanguinolenta TaxID=230812 RepID=A0A8H6ZA71_9AGAR|nr:Defective in cullin neddylation protein [Mycena sanguinolenta]